MFLQLKKGILKQISIIKTRRCAPGARYLCFWSDVRREEFPLLPRGKCRTWCWCRSKITSCKLSLTHPSPCKHKGEISATVCWTTGHKQLLRNPVSGFLFLFFPRCVPVVAFTPIWPSAYRLSRNTTDERMHKNINLCIAFFCLLWGRGLAKVTSFQL